jgi:putative NADPH-quinone reductase
MIESVLVSREAHQMKHLIVVAHPAENSFTMALTRTYAAELERLGHSQRTFDLYRAGFDPVFGAHELAPVDADHPALQARMWRGRRMTFAPRMH